MLMAARDPGTGTPMTAQELLDEVLTLVVAGHETTASALAWAWWLLSRHPDVDARVYEEQTRLGDVGLASYTDLGRMPYTRQVLDEALRLYPPGWLLTRRNIGRDQLGGFELPPGTDVFISPYVIHRHPRHWERPQAFDPAHFDAERVERRHAFAYIPFAAGPRHCIGENFSMYEMLVHLNGTLRRFRLVDPQPAQAIIEARINLRTVEDLQMRVETR
jgi:cytochrome P450